MRWYEVVESRGAIDGNKVTQFQVTLKIGFTLED
jgi:flavin-binding protein dodecin